MTARGIRNNSPGNLRYDADIHWTGLDGPPHDEDGYCRFKSPTFGIRALAKDLLSKYKRGLHSVTDIITVYAPPSENNTAAYIHAVCDAMDVAPRDDIHLTDRQNDNLEYLIRAIITHENGSQPYDSLTIRQAISMAFA
jgi:hypothetical protein